MFTLQYIVPVLIIALAIVTSFMDRLPSPAIAFAGMLAAWGFGWGLFMSGTLWFWGVAMAIAGGIKLLSELPPIHALRYYVTGGTLVGSVLGALSGTMAALIIAGVAGAVLGFMAFRRTPQGRMNASTALTLSIFADVALPAAVTFFISIITLAQLPLFQSL